MRGRRTVRSYTGDPLELAAPLEVETALKRWASLPVIESLFPLIVGSFSLEAVTPCCDICGSECGDVRAKVDRPFPDVAMVLAIGACAACRCLTQTQMSIVVRKGQEPHVCFRSKGHWVSRPFSALNDDGPFDDVVRAVRRFIARLLGWIPWPHRPL